MTSKTSEQQIAANQHNSKLGGVKTAKGKDKIKYNALTHGILSCLITPYEENIHEGLIENLHESFKPIGFIEKAIVDRIALYIIRLFRAGKAEKELMKTILDPTIQRDLFPELSEMIIKKGYQPTIKPEDIETINSIYGRYETSIENRFYKAIHELDRLQRQRRGDHVPSPIAIDFNKAENGFVSQNN